MRDLLLLLIILLFVSSCDNSTTLPYGYTEEEVRKVTEESFKSFPLSMQENNTSSDITLISICEIDESTLTTSNYNHIFVLELDNQELNFSINKNTEEVVLIGSYATSDCKTI